MQTRATASCYHSQMIAAKVWKFIRRRQWEIANRYQVFFWATDGVFHGDEFLRCRKSEVISTKHRRQTNTSMWRERKGRFKGCMWNYGPRTYLQRASESRRHLEVGFLRSFTTREAKLMAKNKKHSYTPDEWTLKPGDVIDPDDVQRTFITRTEFESIRSSELLGNTEITETSSPSSVDRRDTIYRWKIREDWLLFYREYLLY